MQKHILVLGGCIVAAAALVALLATPVALADETCNSPYIANLIKGRRTTSTSGPWASRASATARASW